MKLYKRIIGLTLASILVAVPVMATDYDNHWAKDTIDKWTDKGVINGYEDGTFKPNNALTKAEFAKILSELLGYTDSDGAKQYDDVKDTDWYVPYINRMSTHNIMHDEGNIFNPNSYITREEAAYALVNAFNVQNTSEVPLTFEDTNQISSWATDAVQTFCNLGYMKGLTPTTINPLGHLTRAEFVVLIERLDMDGKISPTASIPNIPSIVTEENSTPSSITNENSTTNSTDEITPTPNTIIGGNVSLVDSDGKPVDFPKNYMIQLEMYLTNNQRVLDHRDFNYNHTDTVHNYEIKENVPLNIGQSYFIKALVRNDDKHDETYYVEQPITWTNELKIVNLVLKAQFEQKTTSDDTAIFETPTYTETIPKEEKQLEQEKQSEQEKQPEQEKQTNQEEQPVITQTTDTQTTFENEVLALVNIERENSGLSPLTMNETLREAARYKSDEMQNLNYFEHESPTYGEAHNLVNKYGVNWRTTGENIAKGQTSPEQVVSSWMNSPGHRANILNGDYTEIGIGYNATGKYWTQIFIG